MKKLLLSLTLSASLLVTPALAAAAVTFTDVAADTWYAPYVEACAEDGLMKGAGGGRFDPGGVMTLPEALTLAARIHHRTHGGDGALPPAPEELTVTEGRPWWIDALWYAVENGILEDAALYTPLPQGPATRWDLARLMAAAAGELEPIREAAPGPGLDAEIWLTVLPLYEAGILNGVDGSGAFHPEGTLTRAEAAAMAARIFHPELRLTEDILRPVPEALAALGVEVTPLPLPGGDRFYTTLPPMFYATVYPDPGNPSSFLNVAIDWAGTVRSDPTGKQYDELDLFQPNGLARVEREGLSGYVNLEGEMVIPCAYTVIDEGTAPLPEGGTADIFLAVDREYSCTVFDAQGEVLSRPDLKPEHLFSPEDGISEGLIPYRDLRTWLYGYLDLDGDVAIPAAYTDVGPFSQGLAAVRNEDQLYGYIDRTGRLVADCQFAQAFPFSCGYALVVNAQGLAGYLDRTGELAIPCRYAWGFNFEPGGYAVVGAGPSPDQLQLGILNSAGELVVPMEYEQLSTFTCGLAPFLRRDAFGQAVTGYLTPDGQEHIIRQDSDEFPPSPFVDGYAEIKVNGKSGLLNTDLELVLPAIFDLCFPGPGGQVLVEYEGCHYRLDLPAG